MNKIEEYSELLEGEHYWYRNKGTLQNGEPHKWYIDLCKIDHGVKRMATHWGHVEDVGFLDYWDVYGPIPKP